MSESNFEVFDPRTLIIDSPEHDHDCDQADFGFAFNNSNFSDRVLRIYIFSESTQPPSAIRVKTLHVSSSILSARSPFFYKLFSNGMRESEQYHATLRISVSEEVGLMELLKFMYSNKLTVTAAIDVFDVLMAADKFDVASCMRHCRHLLRNIMIMTPEFVLVYLDLPSTILMAEALQPLTVFAKQFYAVHYKDITKFEDEILSLPLAGVEAIIASDYTQVVPSEDVVYSFVLKWVQAQYPKLEDRCEILNTRLAKLIRYPYRTYRELENVFHSNELDRFLVLRVLSEALLFQRHYIPPSGTNDANRHRFTAGPQGSSARRDACARLFPLDMEREIGFSLFHSGFSVFHWSLQQVKAL